MTPGGIRIGTPALTTRGFKEADFVRVANLIDRSAASLHGFNHCRVDLLFAGHGRIVSIMFACMFRAVKITLDMKKTTPAPAKMKDFEAFLAAEGAQRADIQALKQEVQEFASGFPMPGL